MLIFAAAAALAATPPQQPAAQPVAPQRQAQATVTIVSGAALRFAEIEKTDPTALRETIIRGADGSAEAIKLVEYR